MTSAMFAPHRRFCPGCGLIPRDCVCEQLTAVDPGLEIRVLLHRAELKKQSNTGWIANAMLESSSVHVYGAGLRFDWEPVIDPDRPGYLFYPAPGAEPASETTFAGDEDPYVLVLDGTWAQARRMYLRNPELRGLRQLTLPADSPDPKWRARAPHGASRYCTLEAVILLLEAVGRADNTAPMWEVLALVQKRLWRQRGIGT